MKNQNNIIVTKDGLVEKSSGRKIVSPIDSSNVKLSCSGFHCQLERIVMPCFYNGRFR